MSEVRYDRLNGLDGLNLLMLRVDNDATPRGVRTPRQRAGTGLGIQSDRRSRQHVLPRIVYLRRTIQHRKYG